MTKKVRTILFLWIPIVLLLGLLGYVFAKKTNGDEELNRYEISRVERRGLTQTVSATGTVEGQKSLDLAFPFQGKIGALLVEEGKEVQAGDPLIQLNNQDQKLTLLSAQSAFDVAKANLDLKLSGVSSEAKKVSEEKVQKTTSQVQSAENSLDIAKKDFEASKISLEQSVKNAETALRGAMDSLEVLETSEENTRLQYENDLKKAYESALTEMKGALSVTVASLSHMDDILGVRNTEANDAIEIYLYSKDRTLYLDAQTALQKAYQTYEPIPEKLNTLTSKDTTSIETLLPEISFLLEKTSGALSLTREVLNEAIVAGSLTETKLSTLRVNIDTDRESVTLKIQSIDTRSQALTTLKIEGKALLDTAHGKVVDAQNTVEIKFQALEQAKIDRDRGILTAEGKVKNAEDALLLAKEDLDLSKASLSETLASPRVIDIASLRAQVESARVKVEEAQTHLDRTVLRAPVAGSVTDFLVEVGEEVTPQKTVATFLNTGSFLVRANISEADIPLVSVGDEAHVTLDAYGEDTPFSGEVIHIASGPTLLQDVVYYQIETTLSHGEREVKPSMTANLAVFTEKKENVLVIPQRAIRFQDNKNMVRVLQGETVESREVITGLKGDDGLTEVVSGVSEGEEVVIFDREERKSKF